MRELLAGYVLASEGAMADIWKRYAHISVTGDLPL